VAQYILSHSKTREKKIEIEENGKHQANLVWGGEKKFGRIKVHRKKLEIGVKKIERLAINTKRAGGRKLSEGVHWKVRTHGKSIKILGGTMHEATNRSQNRW